MRTLLSWLVGLPVAVVAVLFTLSNRQDVTLGLWPFEEGVVLPLVLVVAACLVVGFAAGFVVAGIGSLRHRSAARRMARRNAELEREIEQLRPRPDTPPPASGSPAP